MRQAIRTLPVQRTWSRPFKFAAFWGVISLVMYGLVFSNQAAVTRFFTRGGVMAVAVVVTALVFSIIHGTFANYVLDVCGIEALKQDKEKH
jgi:uncharacterized membrane protein (DUF485 family)